MKENTNCLINYSIIIPHKNTPLLLRRCLDSIPERDDIEVIIVDDNSMNINWDDWKFNTNVSLLKTYKNKGAGFARNIGLKRAVGKWILFADSDDFFSQQFTLLLDGYRDSDYDIIYFMFTSVYSDSLLPSNRASSAIKRLKNADKSKQLDPAPRQRRGRRRCSARRLSSESKGRSCCRPAPAWWRRGSCKRR